MYKSFKEYIPVVLSRWWAMIVFGVGDVLGIVTTVSHNQLLLPTWAWFIIGTVALFIAMFLAFHKVRQERDAAKGDVNSTIRELRNLKLNIEGKTVDLVEILHKLWDGQSTKMTLGDVAGVIRSHWGKDDSDVKLIKDTNFVVSQLSLYQIFQSIQIREVSGSHQYDKEYWVLTDLGKKVLNSIKGCDST